MWPQVFGEGTAALGVPWEQRLTGAVGGGCKDGPDLAGGGRNQPFKKRTEVWPLFTS